MKKDDIKTIQLAVRIPEYIVEELDKHVDKIRFRSRAHLITIILADWLQKSPEEQKKIKSSRVSKKLKQPKKTKELL